MESNQLYSFEKWKLIKRLWVLLGEVVVGSYISGFEKWKQMHRIVGDGERLWFLGVYL